MYGISNIRSSVNLVQIAKNPTNRPSAEPTESPTAKPTSEPTLSPSKVCFEEFLTHNICMCVWYISNSQYSDSIH